MMKSTVVLSLMMVLGAGCSASAESGVDTHEDAESTSSADTTCTYTAANAIAGQREATKMFAYILGDTTQYAASNARTPYLESLRTSVANGWITIGSATSTSICGLPSLVRTLTQADTRAALGANVNGALSNLNHESAHVFFFASSPVPVGTVSTVSVNQLTILGVDPEPAQVRASLSGSSGASAAAVYVNSQTPTNVVKWSAGYALGGANPPTAGAPCSTVDLAVDAQATQAIFKNGSYYKCL